MIILQCAEDLKKIESQYLFRFIAEKRAHLFLIGVNFELTSSESVAVKYNSCLNEIKKLSPDKQLLFNALKEKYVQEERQRRLDDQAREEREKAVAEARLESLAAISEDRRKAMEEFMRNPDMSVDQMPDCQTKLAKVRQHCLDNACKFTDTQFDHEDEDKVYGNLFEKYSREDREMAGWKRASDMEGAVLFKGTASHLDI